MITGGLGLPVNASLFDDRTPFNRCTAYFGASVTGEQEEAQPTGA